MKRELREKKRSFGGKTENFKNKEEKRFEEKHLKAYLKGSKRFADGKDSITGLPKYFLVKENWV